MLPRPLLCPTFRRRSHWSPQKRSPLIKRIVAPEGGHLKMVEDVVPVCILLTLTIREPDFHSHEMKRPMRFQKPGQAKVVRDHVRESNPFLRGFSSACAITPIPHEVTCFGGQRKTRTSISALDGGVLWAEAHSN